MVVWASPGYLRQTRGWVWFELAYAELIEQSLDVDSIHDTGLRSYPFVVPIFRGLRIKTVERTPLLGYWQRNLVPHGRDFPIDRVAQRLIDFHAANAADRSGD